jgi:hypothetical protein
MRGSHGQHFVCDAGVLLVLHGLAPHDVLQRCVGMPPSPPTAPLLAFIRKVLAESHFNIPSNASKENPPLLAHHWSPAHQHPAPLPSSSPPRPLLLPFVCSLFRWRGSYWLETLRGSLQKVSSLSTSDLTSTLSGKLRVGGHSGRLTSTPWTLSRRGSAFGTTPALKEASGSRKEAFIMATCGRLVIE